MAGMFVERKTHEIGVLHHRHPRGDGGIDLDQLLTDRTGSRLLLTQDRCGGVRAASASEHGLGGGEQLAHELALPAVPDTRAHSADIGHGQDQQQAHPLRIFHDPRKGRHGARIGHITLLGIVAHDQMVLDQPRDQFDPVALQPQSLTGRASRPSPGLFLTALAALARIVQQHGEEQDLAVLDQRPDAGGQRMVLAHLTGGNIGYDAHSPQGVLINRIGMVHIELHLSDDAAKFRKIAPQDPGLIHQGQGAIGAFAAR